MGIPRSKRLSVSEIARQSDYKKHGALWHDDGHETDLHRAARGNESLVRYYIGAFHGSNQLSSFLNSRNVFKRTPLHSAAEWNAPTIIPVLLDAGADLIALEDKSRTALFWAAERNNTQCVKALLDFASRKTVDLPNFVDHRNSWRRTALEETVMRRHIACVRMLLDHNATVMTHHVNGESALILATLDLNKTGWRECVPMASLILDKAKDTHILEKVINARRNEGDTSLYHASDLGAKDMVAFLLSQGADYAISTKDQVSPLHRACW